MKICHSLDHFELCSIADVFHPLIANANVITDISIVRLDTLSGKDICHIANVTNCGNGGGRHGKDWSKEVDQKFLALLLIAK